MAQPHRAVLPEDCRMDQRAGTEIGRMFLLGRISEAKYWAAERWQSIITQFHVVLATPMVGGSSLGRMVAPGIGQDEASGNSERPETEEEMHDRVLAQHGAAMRVLRDIDHAPLVFMALEHVVLKGLPASAKQVERLNQGLSALCRLWKMDEDGAGYPQRAGTRKTAHSKAPWPYDEKEVKIVYADD
ncbi:hypothetical protein [Ancylobacter pratisalsi]|uniref:Uncharacterized protein n=1 Tax=Ancylobacter pratisalsi TaxID=1745854 RepID=A0A6P1YIX2_9HYPH|nr:hypothetical protein [Ancylobacter pratisalsi]QIB32646.1 hypothetical protein G3A50_02205 [Ancylobacter pratisalsi]